MKDRDAPHFPRTVYGQGEDPDPRFSLANERTFLAWIRTALALIAAGVAVMVVPADISEPFGQASAIALISLGIAAAVRAWIGWCHVELSLRLNRPLPGAGFSAVVSTVLVVVTIALAIDLLR